MPSEHSRSILAPHLAERWRALQATKLYDMAAAAPVFIWYSLMGGSLVKTLAARFAAADMEAIDLSFIVGTMGKAASLLFVLMLLAFVLLRRPAEAKAKGLTPRITAIAGTFLGISVVQLPPQELSLGLSFLSLFLVLSGVGFSIYSLRHLGRSFSLMAEARRLVTDGPYAFIRHPLYLGEAVSMLGLTLQYASPLAFAILAIQLGLQLQRMKNEESVLAAMFPEYEAYRQKTPRLVPGVY